MELKLAFASPLLGLFSLLIVPYGIETTKENYLIAASLLLIVPYGIETKL